MGQNLTGQTIASTYEDLVQISGSVFTDGLGNDITSATITASNAISSSYALTASFALNAGGADTGSLMVTGSVNLNTLTFTKGDGSTFDLTVNTGSGGGGTVNTGSLMITGSVSLNTLTFTKGDGSTFDLTVNTGSAVTVNTGSLLVTASISDATTTYTKGDGSTFDLTVNNVENAFTSSYVATAVLTGSVSSNTLTFTKFDGSTFDLTVDTGSAVSVDTGSLLVTASISDATITFTKGDASTFDIVVNNVQNASTASAVDTTPASDNVEYDLVFVADSAAGTQIVRTDDNANITFNPSTGVLTAPTLDGNALTATSASLALQVQSNNNDADLDYKLTFVTDQGKVDLYNTQKSNLLVNPNTGKLTVTSVSASSGFTGSLFGTASFALTASYVEGGVNPFPLTGSIDALIPSGSVFSVRSTGGGTSWGPDIILMGNYSGSNVAISKTSANSYNNIIIGAGTNTSPNRIISSSLDGNVLIGGASNRASGRAQRATIVGGFNNQIASGSDLGGSATIQNNGIFAGSSNQIVHGSGNFIGGGSSNTIVSSSFDTTPSQNAILGGNFNQITGSDNSALIGGLRNRIADASLSAIIAGTGSIVTGTQSAVIAGRNHLASHSASVVIGGNNLSTTQDNEVVVPNLTISGSGNVLTFADGTTQSTAATGGSTFPYTGSAIISGSLEVTGSINIDVNSSISGSNLVGNWADTYSTSPKVHQIVTLTQAEYNALTPNENTLYVISGSTFTAANTAGNNTFTENNVFSGSVRGDVGALSITSNTASMDCSEGNFFTITLVSGSTTHLNPTNIQPGQTINLLVNTTGSGLLTFAPSVLQVTGSAYTATTGSGTIGKDIITFISFNSTNLYLSNIKNFI